MFEKELEAVRAREELEKKRVAAEKALRIEKLKRKIRAKKVRFFTNCVLAFLLQVLGVIYVFLSFSLSF